MLQIFNQSIVYIFCPAGSVTGGPEALHQLCHKINTCGGNAKMVYVDYSTEKLSTKSTIPFRYRHYNISIAERPIDDVFNVIVVPEIWPNLLMDFKRIQKCVWWLSVNYASERFALAFSDASIHHLYQSAYAKDFLVKNRAPNCYPLYDYLSLSPSKQNAKEKTVIYNPKKGLETTEKIINRFAESHIKFIALKGFTRSGLLQVMKRSMVYIDFGDHPGKDRIPREAAIHHNIVIASQSGSADYDEDLPIPRKFKIRESDLEQICASITNAINSYDELTPLFDYYRRVINNQEKEFTLQVKNLFCSGKPSFVFTLKRIFGIDVILKFYFDRKEKLIEKIRISIPPSIKKRIKRFGNY